MRVYISGPMSGIKDYNRPAFNEAEEELRTRGYDVFNPASVHIENGTWSDYLRYDIARMMECDAIYMLPGWEASKGATLEKGIANRVGIHTVE